MYSEISEKLLGRPVLHTDVILRPDGILGTRCTPTTHCSHFWHSVLWMLSIGVSDRESPLKPQQGSKFNHSSGAEKSAAQNGELCPVMYMGIYCFFLSNSFSFSW